MQMTEQTFTTWDGTQLFYRAWLPEKPAARAVFLFHRGHEHSARWQETVAALGLGDTAFFAWDQRGHGRSPGERGHAPGFGALVKDVDVFARHMSATHGIPLAQTALVASSLGAVVAVAWVHDYAPPLRGMVLAAPAFRVRLYVPLAIPGLRMMHKVMPRSVVKSYVKSGMLTYDAKEAAAYDADPLIFRQIAVNMLLDMHDAGKRLVDDAGAINTPTLLLTAGKDWVVTQKAQQEFFRRLGAPVKQMEMFPEMQHSLFHEKRRQCVTDRVRSFLQDCFMRPPQNGELVDADKGGYTKTEFDLLRTPESMRWPMVRGVLRTFGRLSEGIRVGWRTGFDSGITLDYVYRNKARGFPVVGTLIDRAYLNSPGWTGIRVRRQHLEGALERAIRELHREVKPVHILDIASGPGRYVIETMKRLREIPTAAMLRDYMQANLDEARTLADRLSVPNVATLLADAFDRDSLAATNPRPTIAITSGIFELFPENEPVRRALAGVADAMEPGGYLIYTAQIWHPQIEFIARALTNREGKPWVMRRRTQAEMDALVHAAGFEKVDQQIDRWGIFTVSLARRSSDHPGH